MQSLVIGICGGTGSGKSTLASNIKQRLQGDALLLEMDSYYKPFSELSFEERACGACNGKRRERNQPKEDCGGVS